MKITTIALIPPEGDPQGLLKKGPCGYRPPIISKDRWSTQWDTTTGLGIGDGAGVEALAFATKGQVIGPGIDRAARRGGICFGLETERRVRAYLSGDTSATYIVHPEAGTIVLLDRDGNEVER